MNFGQDKIMCYSARCVWEDYMGECMFSYQIIEVRDKYDKIKCGITSDEYFKIYEEEAKMKVVKQRKSKIISLKTKLLDKSEYI